MNEGAKRMALTCARRTGARPARLLRLFETGAGDMIDAVWGKASFNAKTPPLCARLQKAFGQSLSAAQHFLTGGRGLNVRFCQVSPASRSAPMRPALSFRDAFAARLRQVSQQSTASPLSCVPLCGERQDWQRSFFAAPCKAVHHAIKAPRLQTDPSFVKSGPLPAFAVAT